jgi:hypothetical protein
VARAGISVENPDDSYAAKMVQVGFPTLETGVKLAASKKVL